MQPMHTVWLTLGDVVVLRRNLRPLSCGHIYWLMAIDSPYVFPDNGRPTIADLIAAVAVCSKSWMQLKKWLSKGERAIYKETIKWGRRCRGVDFVAESLKFVSYLGQCCSPIRWVEVDSGGNPKTEPCRTPWPLLVAARLLRVYGDGVWDLPVSEALSYFCAYDELNGDDSLRGVDEARWLEKVKNGSRITS